MPATRLRTPTEKKIIRLTRKIKLLQAALYGVERQLEKFIAEQSVHTYMNGRPPEEQEPELLGPNDFGRKISDQ